MRARLRSFSTLFGVLLCAIALAVAVTGLTVALASDADVDQRLATTVETLESHLLRQALLVETAGPVDIGGFTR